MNNNAEPVGIFVGPIRPPNLVQKIAWILVKCLTVPLVFLFTGRPLLKGKDPMPPIMWPLFACCVVLFGPLLVFIWSIGDAGRVIYEARGRIGNFLFGSWFDSGGDPGV